MASLAYGAAQRFRNLSLAMLFGIGAAAAEPVTIAAFGDSLTAGYGLAPEAGFVPQLQGWLQANGAEAVLRNAGVSGDTTQGALARIGWTLDDGVDAMIVTLGGNDMLRGIAPELARQNLAGILQAAQATKVQVLLVGLQAPGNYGADYKSQFDAIYPDLARKFGAGLVPNFLAPVSAAIESGTPMHDLMQADSIHPNAAGVALIVEAIGPAVLKLIDGLN